MPFYAANIKWYCDYECRLDTIRAKMIEINYKKIYAQVVIMKILNVPILAVSLVIVALIKGIAQINWPAASNLVDTFLTGVLLGVLLAYFLYYANTRWVARVNSRKIEN